VGLYVLLWVMVREMVKIDDGCEELVETSLQTLMGWHRYEKLDQRFDVVSFLGFLGRGLALRNVGVLDVLASQMEK
jgi:hypothetical protein